MSIKDLFSAARWAHWLDRWANQKNPRYLVSMRRAVVMEALMKDLHRHIESSAPGESKCHDPS